MSDTCRHCEVHGNIVDCRNTPCHTHESWYAQQQDAEIERLQNQITEIPTLCRRYEAEIEGLQRAIIEEYIPINSYEAMLDRNKKIYRNVIDTKDAEIERLKAQVDALMLEFCPDEMTPEQVARWGENQKPALDTTKPDTKG